MKKEKIRIFDFFAGMTPDQVMYEIRQRFDIGEDDETRRTVVYIPPLLKDFFKAVKIKQKTAIENGLLFYMALILWKEFNPIHFDKMDEFMLYFLKNHHLSDRG